MSQPVPAGYTVFPWASLPASFTLTAVTGGKRWAYSGTTLYLDTTTPILNMFADQPGDVFGGTGATGWMRIQRVGTSGGAESVRHAGFDMFLNGWGGGNFDFSWRFYYVTGGDNARVIIGNNYPNNGVGHYVADSGNGRVRINVTTTAAATVFTISNLINGYGLYDGTYLQAAPFITSTDTAWHSVMVTRTASPGKSMTHIGHPDVSVSLANRSFYGYMSEVILFAPIVPAQSSTVPDYNIFYKNAHVPFWQNGLIASYTPENWTGSSWVNGNFGTLPVTTLTGTTTKTSAANYQNIFTNLSAGAQTAARAIFSFRRVNTLYLGPNFRIRRSSDNFVQAFYADGAGNLGTAIGATGQPLLDWLGGSIPYVETWYDQSLNVRHATQTTWTLQPTLSLAKLAVDFTTNGTMFNLPTGTVPMNIPYTFVARHGYMSTSVSGGIIGAGGTNTTNQTNNFMGNPSFGYYNYWFNNDATANLGGPPVKESVVSCRYDGPTTAGTTYFFVNGVQTNSVARSGWNGVAGGEMIGKTTNDSTLNGLLYDCFIFASALSDADRTSIENTVLNSSSALPSLYGPTSASITWPTGIVPSTYSMFHLAKYQKPSQGNNRRILQGLTTNWLSGFWSGYSGVAFHNGWLTQSVASAHGTNWVLSTDQNSLYRSLGRTRGTTGAGTPSFDTLAINAGNSPVETTDFTFQAMMVYNRTLTATEYQMVEDYLANRFKIPVAPQEGLALSLDASDYFTTDTTTWTDRSPNGRNFTLATAGAYVSTGAFPYMALSTSRATIATAVPSATYNTLIVFGTIKNSTANWRGLIARDGALMQVFIESGTNRLGMYNGSFIPCDQNVDVTTLDQVYTRFNMHVWKLSTVSPYYQYYFNPTAAPCRPTGVITDSRASYTAGFAFLSDSDAVSARYWGDMGTVLYYNRDLSDQELVETYQRHMTKYLLPTPFVPTSPVPNGYVFTRSGMYTPGTGVTALKVLVIAGGGGGGGGWEGGGGGAGGLLFSGFYYVTAGVPIQVIIGQGGRGTRRNSLPENGGNTIFGTMTAIGGGAGAAEQNTASIGPAAVVARSGGSGGGGSWGAPSGDFIFPPGAGTTGQGNMGGAGFGAPYIGGGGGGAATPGFDASFAYAGNGGDGRSWTIMGVTKMYCGGGGGSLRGSGTSSGGLGGGGGGNGAGTGANATYYGSGGGAGGGNGTACMGGDGFQGIVLVEVNVDPYPVPVLQNPGNQNFQAGGQFNINQTVAGIADLTWVLTQVYNAPNLTSPGNQTFTNGGTFTVTNITNPYLTGALVWTINPTTGMSLVSNTSTSATFLCSAFPGISAVQYVVTATGPSGVAGSTSGFIVTNTSTYLYNFSSFTFTPMGATGRSGPTAITYGSSTPGFGTGSVMTLGSGTSTGMQLWVVPFTANYVFTVAGARGGNGTQTGGNGAIITVTLALTSGHVLRLLPGQIGTAAVSGCGITKAGGGGGSFVYNNNTSTILIAAGGGGGGSGGPIVTLGLRDASLTTSGKKGDGTTGGAGGTAGNGGIGGSPACTSGGGGGGGWSGNGGNGAGYNGNLGLSLINGGTGGFNDNEGTTNGGFGGAGAAGAHAGGGGGGYSGGGGGTLQTCSCGDTQVGGGGGSYATVAFTSSSVTNTGAGYITITLANPNLPIVVNPGNKQLNTTSANSFSVSQTTSTTLTGAITWTYSTLPSGMTVTSSTGSIITFGLSAGTQIIPQSFTVTATGANYPIDPSSTTFTLGASTSSIPGISQYYPATNAAQILAADPTVTNGVYWINCNGVSTQIYCIMNSLYDGGGWMLLMKGPQGSTFEYNSTYWTSSTTTLNTTDTNINNNDAKFAAFNSVTVKDVMAWWPDVGITGGTIPSTPYWTWHINNWYNTDFPTLSADTTVINAQTYIASASSSWDSNYFPWRAFDYSTSTEWHTQQTATYNNGPYTGALTTTVSGVSRAGEWLQLQYPSSVTITSYEIQARNGQNSTAPTVWWIAGSTNGSTWTLIDTRTAITWQTNLQTITFTPATPGTYSYYRIIINAVGLANYASMSAFNIRTTATSTRLTAFDGMSSSFSRNAPGASDPNTWGGNSTSIWSRQSGAWRHVIGGPGVVSGNQSVRWGFLYNNEADFGSIDVSGGIGMSQVSRSAGDTIGCCQSTTGLNRAMSFLFFGR